MKKHLQISILFLSLLFATHSFGQLNANLVTSNPTTEAKNLYQFLKDNYGKKIISGIQEMGDVNWLYSNTGKYVALMGGDFMNQNRGYGSWYDEMIPVNDAKNWYNRNGIPTLCWHWRDPSRKTEYFYTKSAQPTQYTSFDVTKIWDSNSSEYKAMISDIDYIAGRLKTLRDAGVPILWRPLHEAAGGWFWWGLNGSACAQLWRVMFDRLVNYHGLKNLIWVYTKQPNDDAFYPGDAYVDIVGRDYYYDGNHGSILNEYNEINNKFGGKKIVTITECGSFPDPDNLTKDKANWSWYMVWPGDYVRNSKYNSLDLWKKALGHSYVLTLDEMPNLRTYSGGCSSTAITPYLQINGGTRQQTGYASVAPGTQVILGPQPSTGGSWNWNGGCGTSGTSREQTIYPTGDCDILATYTNSCGGKSSYTFQIRMTGAAQIVSGDIYSIIARHSGKALDVANAGTVDGTNVQQWTNYSYSNQQWIITDASSGYYKVSPVSSTDKVLDVSGSGTADGTNVQIWTNYNATNQQWQFVANGSYYNIKARNSGKCLDVSSASTADGANVQLWTCGSGTNQQWSLTMLKNGAANDLSKITPEGEVQIYPNPSDGIFDIKGVVSGTIKIYDLNGKLLMTKVINASSTRIRPELSKGVYLAQITNQNSTKIIKLVIR
jgi:mannan endo-1,4-beta-mannosidase